MKSFVSAVLILIIMLSFSACGWKVEILNPNEEAIINNNEISVSVSEPEDVLVSDPEEFPEGPVSSEPGKAEKPALTYSDSGNTYILKKSEPDFGAEISYIDYINIVNDRLYASSRNSSDGVFTADFNGENGCVLETRKDGSSFDNIEDICSAGENNIFILKTDIPEEEPFELRQTAIKTDSEGNLIEEYLLAEMENGYIFGEDIVFDKSGNFYLWSYWGKVLVFRNGFSESFCIDLSEETTFYSVVPLNNGTAYITTGDGTFLLDHENKSFGKKIDVPVVTVFKNSGNSKFDFVCHDYENLCGYIFEENRLEKLINFAEYEINPDLLHSADIDENGNITVITKEILRYEPNIFMIFHFEKEN